MIENHSIKEFHGKTLLGQTLIYLASYAPDLLSPIPRSHNRKKMGLDQTLPFSGMDVWNAYELSWLDLHGKPQLGWGVFYVPCDSEYMLESKSLKLYLNSLNLEKIASIEDLKEKVYVDVSQVINKEFYFDIILYSDYPINTGQLSVPTVQGICLDGLEVEIKHYHRMPDYLRCVGSASVVSHESAAGITSTEIQKTCTETLYSHLFRSRCPVTGQPDWATIIVEYTGCSISREGLLKYIISYRDHEAFHEDCIERIFMDAWQQCKPEQLSVYGRFVRRGGIDINPYRSSVFEIGRPVNQRQLNQ